MTRIQKERFASPAAYEKVKNSFVLDSRLLKKLGKEAIIMHPLPKVNEIAPEIDDSKYARYFKQAHNGIPVRMAIIEHVLAH